MSMKKVALFLIVTVCSLMTYAQQTLPSVDLKTLDGKSINTKDLSNEGKPFAVCFWATWCKPCLMELRVLLLNFTKNGKKKQE